MSDTKQQESISHDVQDPSIDASFTLVSQPQAASKAMVKVEYKKPSFATGLIARVEIKNPAVFSEKVISRTETINPSAVQVLTSPAQAPNKRMLTLTPSLPITKTRANYPVASVGNTPPTAMAGHFTSQKFTPKIKYVKNSASLEQKSAPSTLTKLVGKLPFFAKKPPVVNQADKIAATPDTDDTAAAAGTKSKKKTLPESRDELFARLKKKYKNIDPPKENKATPQEDTKSITQEEHKEEHQVTPEEQSTAGLLESKPKESLPALTYVPTMPDGHQDESHLAVTAENHADDQKDDVAGKEQKKKKKKKKAPEHESEETTAKSATAENASPITDHPIIETPAPKKEIVPIKLKKDEPAPEQEAAVAYIKELMETEPKVISELLRTWINEPG